jgi:cell division protein FtsN
MMITKRHIAAASITTLTLSLFTGVVGYQSGRKLSIHAEKPSAVSLLPDVEHQETLEALLVEIEQTEHIRVDHDYQFVRELQKDQPISIPEKPNSSLTETTVESSESDENLPELPSNPLPSGGWAIQVASFPTIGEANDEALKWNDRSQQAYVVVAALHGDIWYRVRIAGYADKAQAELQRKSIQTEMNEFDYMVVKAP